MKHMSLLTLLFFAGLQSYSQLAIIKDPDGYVNVREEESLASKVVGRLNNDDIFTVSNDTPNDEWWSVYKTTRGSYIQGYIYRSRLIEIEHLAQVPKSQPNRKLTSKFLSISNDSIEFSIVLKRFNAKEHLVKRNKQGFVEKIDGAIPNGVDGGLPKFEISSLDLKIRRKPVIIPKEAYKDLYEIGLSCVNLHFDNRGNIYVYLPCNSDGAGGYFATWVIKDSKYKKRYVDTL